jgi:hypothetical protein
MFVLRTILSLFFVVLVWTTAAAQTTQLPVIDLHLHAGPSGAASEWYSLEANETPDAAQTRYLLGTLDAHSITRGIIGGPPATLSGFAAPTRPGS